MKPFLLAALLLAALTPSVHAITPITPSKECAIVEKADFFSVGGVGITGRTSDQEAAFRAILKRSDAIRQFQRMLSTAGTPGQMYALLGLHQLDKKAFEAAAPPYLENTATVKMMMGCVGGMSAVKDLTRQIRDGMFE